MRESSESQMTRRRLIRPYPVDYFRIADNPGVIPAVHIKKRTFARISAKSRGICYLEAEKSS
jgi:hypothetical protein